MGSRRILGHKKRGGEVYVIPVSFGNNIIHYYRFNDNVNDIVGGLNGIVDGLNGSSSIVYADSEVGRSADFDDALQAYFKISGLQKHPQMSVIIRLKLDEHTPTNTHKTGLMAANTCNAETVYPYTNGTIYMGLLTNSRKTVGTGVIADRTQPHTLIITADTVTNVWKFYQNNTLVTTSTVGTLTINNIIEVGKGSTTQFYLNGLMDELCFCNKVLTAADIEEANLRFNSGQHLI